VDDRPRTHACETSHPLYGGSFPLSAITSAQPPWMTFAPRIIYGQGQDTRAHNNWPSPGPPGTTNKVTGGLALRLYDVTTLYFKAEKEDDLCKVGYSKEHRGDPQVIVGLLVDRGGFPPENRVLGGQPGRDHHDHRRVGGLPGRSRHRRARHRLRAPACSRRPT